MIFLDTHVVLWLYEGLTDKFSKKAIELIEENPLQISPFLELELTYLQEIHKINQSAQIIIKELQAQIGLQISKTPLEKIIQKSLALSWTRDPFDRLMVAEAMCQSAMFLTKDMMIRKHYKMAVWE